MKKVMAVLVLMAVPTLAFAGGPASNLPVQAQLHQEAQAIHADTAAIRHGIPLAKMTPRVQRLDFALQNTAAQMHVKASFSHMANQLMTKPTRKALLGNLKAAGQWVKAESAGK
ncbi:hypothetical protein HAP94_16750 [Acidithiobacillus ferrivorans]|nr:hypothetical protein [Acidithiobacillus ferrivorans]